MVDAPVRMTPDMVGLYEPVRGETIVMESAHLTHDPALGRDRSGLMGRIG